MAITGGELERGKVSRIRVWELVMSTKRQKRITKQVRIDKYWHMVLRSKSVASGKTASALLDEICRHYFKDEKKYG